MKKLSFPVSILLACCWVISLTGICMLQHECRDDDTGTDYESSSACKRRYGYTWFAISLMCAVSVAGIVISTKYSYYSYYRFSLMGITVLATILYYDLCYAWLLILDIVKDLNVGVWDGFSVMVAGLISSATVSSILIISLGLPEISDSVIPVMPK